MNYMQSRGLSQININPSATQLQPMQSYPAGQSMSGGMMGGPYGMAGNMIGGAVQSFGQPNQPNYGSNIAGGALSGAGTGAAIGSVVPGIGTAIGAVAGGLIGGVKGLFGSSSKDKQLEAQEEAKRKQQEQMQRQSMIQNRMQSYNQNNPDYNYAPTFKTGGMLSSYPNGGTIQGLGIGQLPTETVEAPTKFDTRPVYRQHFAKMSPEQIDAVRRQSNATTNEGLQEAFNRLYTKGPNTQYLAGNNSVYQMTRRGEPLYQQVERSPGMGNYRDIDFNNAPLSDKETLDIYNEQYKSVYPDKNSYLNQMNLQREVAGFADIPGLNLGMGNRAGHEYYAKGGSIKIDPSKKANFAKNFAKADGGYLEQTRYNPDITAYNSGGSTHETSPYGGIPIGNKGSVESGEVRYGDYIFSDRF